MSGLQNIVYIHYRPGGTVGGLVGNILDFFNLQIYTYREFGVLTWSNDMMIFKT